MIGAGTMGADIAAWCAWNGLTVTLADMKSEPLGAAMKRAARAVSAAAPRQERSSVRDALDRLIPDLKGEGARHADLIIEAVPEVLGLKQKIFAAMRSGDEAGRHPRHQHVEHSARTVARRPEAAGALPRHPLLQSGAACCSWSRSCITTRSRRTWSRPPTRSSARSTSCRCRSRARRASSSTAR